VRRSFWRQAQVGKVGCGGLLLTRPVRLWLLDVALIGRSRSCARALGRAADRFHARVELDQLSRVAGEWALAEGKGAAHLAARRGWRRGSCAGQEGAKRLSR